ncbi:hypothetical protein GGR28_003634 [Lewinella aquimaris]|uniref:Uncharacterized protein n=1 Tax=Neolewinella aquimaris TaxID=1835722 RepID=A0A840EAM6_9BACT|nr:sigma-70 family RNA polymerase sigma factor [Neolewinella aquimaris]MBB4080993.1 hypothetical protein [Neolewinella aquimaris]
MFRTNPFSRGTPPLARIIAAPDRYTLEEIRDSVLQLIAKWYRQPIGRISRLAHTSPSGGPALQVATGLAGGIKSGTLTEIKRIKGTFARQFDNRLLSCVRQDPVQREKIFRYWYETFRWMVDRDGEASRSCPQAANRLDAYHNAMTSLYQKALDPAFSFERGSGIYLRAVFRTECASQSRHRLTHKEHMERAATDIDLTGFDQGVIARLTFPPPVLTQESLDHIKHHHRRCYTLLHKRYLGYSYEELAVIFRKTAGSLRNEISKCRKELRERYQST